MTDEINEMEITDVIQYFHNSIKSGSKYIMYLLQSVVVYHQLQNMMLEKYTTCKCTKNLLDVCRTGKTIVDNTEWVCLTYRKILKMSPGAYIFQRPFLRGLFLEGLMYGGKFAFQNRLG